MAQLLLHPQLATPLLRYLNEKQLLQCRELSSEVETQIERFLEDETVEYILRGRAFRLPHEIFAVASACQLLGYHDNRLFQSKVVAMLVASLPSFTIEPVSTAEDDAAPAGGEGSDDLRTPKRRSHPAMDEELEKAVTLYRSPSYRHDVFLAEILTNLGNTMESLIDQERRMKPATELRLKNNLKRSFCNIGGQAFSKVRCYVTALELCPDFHRAWYNLSNVLLPEEQMEVAGEKLTQMSCLSRALRLAPNSFTYWEQASAHLSHGSRLLQVPDENGIVQSLDAADCRAKVLDLALTQQSSKAPFDPVDTDRVPKETSISELWYRLSCDLTDARSNVRAPLVQGVKMTNVIDILVKALESDDFRPAQAVQRKGDCWSSLGWKLAAENSSGILIHGSMVSTVQCLVNALTLHPDHALDWWELCQTMKQFGVQKVTVNGFEYDPPLAHAQAQVVGDSPGVSLVLKSLSVGATINLGGVLYEKDGDGDMTVVER